MTLKRRTFIKTGLTVGAAAGLGGLTGCGPLTRSAREWNSVDAKALPGLDPVETKILYYASLAPSGHNAQPWLVKIQAPGRWLLAADPARKLAVVDPLERESRLSLGCFIENLVLAAGQLGRRVQVEPLTGDPAQGVALISLDKARAEAFDLNLITSRRTIRDGLSEAELKTGDLAGLKKAAGPDLHYFSRRSEHGRCIAQGTLQAFKTQTASDQAQAELARWTRLSNSEAGKHQDGLTTASMGITGLAGWWVRTFMSSKDVMGRSWRNKGDEKTTEQVGQGGGWLILTGPDKSTADLLQGGRRFQRLALKARELNIGLQPMSQMLEETSGQQEIAANHDNPVSPLLIIRAGYVTQYPSPVSLRRPVSWFVKGEK